METVASPNPQSEVVVFSTKGENEYVYHEKSNCSSIGCHRYPWNVHCSLRQWLNEDFYNAAFTEEEQKRIFVETNENPEHDPYKTSSGRTTVDRVSVLSQEEANSLFTTVAERMAAPTAYAKAQGAYLNPETKTAWWWLRTTSYLNDHVTYTTSLGGVSVNGREVTRQDAGVRPVIWITVE